MLTRCPGCAKEISETADICPNCKRDFRLPSARPSPKPAEKPPEPKQEAPAEKKPPAQEQRPHLVTRCPGCAREIAESAEICPYCKRDFRPASRRPPPSGPGPAPRQEKPKEPDLPKHMLADIEAPPQEKPGSKPPEAERPREERRPDPRPLNPDLPHTMIIGTLPPSGAVKREAPVPDVAKPPEAKAPEVKAPETRKPEPAAGDKPKEASPAPAKAATEEKPAAIAPEAKVPAPKPAEDKTAEAKDEEKAKSKDGPHAVLLTRCPGCAKPISETVDICPHCKRDFRTAAQKAGIKEPPPASAPAKAGPKELDLPRHMMADLDSAPRTLDSEAARVLPPHMLESQTGDIRTEPEPPKKGTAFLFVVVGIIILGALLGPKLMRKPEPPPVVVETPAPEPTPAPQPEPQPEQKPPEAQPGEKPPEPVVQEPPEPAPVEKKPKGKKGRKTVPEEGATVSVPEPPPPPKRAAKCRIQGKIFDLVTLKGVPDVDIMFVDASGQNVRTVSGPDGNYRATLPSTGRGYELQVRHEDYLPKYILDNSFRSMSEDSRKAEAKRFMQFSPNNPLIASQGEEQIRQDFAMIAREKHGKTLEEALQQ